MNLSSLLTGLKDAWANSAINVKRYRLVDSSYAISRECPCHPKFFLRLSTHALPKTFYLPNCLADFSSNLFQTGPGAIKCYPRILSTTQLQPRLPKTNTSSLFKSKTMFFLMLFWTLDPNHVYCPTIFSHSFQITRKFLMHKMLASSWTLAEMFYPKHALPKR